MYINKNKSGKFRTSHRLICVLSAAAVLFCTSSCSRNVRTDATDIDFPSVLPISRPEQEHSAPYSDTNIDTPTADPLPSASTEASQSDLNMASLERINDYYGVNIRYGSAVNWNYEASGTGITDDELIKERLSLLEDCLEMYPLELFADLKEQSPITINLIDGLNGADGYTDARNTVSIQIALNCENSAAHFKLAFHHELFHFIEYYIMYRFPDEEPALSGTDAWNDASLYGTGDYTGTIYDGDSDVYHQYFTSVYAKSNAMEDRAEIFSYYMGSTCKDCMKVPDSPITEKMKLIADSIRIYCPSLAVYPQGSLPWEKKIAY